MTNLLRGKVIWTCVVCCCVMVPCVQAGWINEIHYDNAGGDIGEFVEIVLEPGEVIGDFSLEFYNGSGGGTYSVTTSQNTGAVINGFSIFSFGAPGLQNGAPDGVALLSGGAVVPGQFLSYEGSFTATNGAANGLTSTDIGVSELSTTPIGESLQLNGTGAGYSDFAWTGPTAESPGAANVGQTLVPEPTSLVLASLGLLMAISTHRRRREN